jgi:hypothetical protein
MAICPIVNGIIDAIIVISNQYNFLIKSKRTSNIGSKNYAQVLGNVDETAVF